MFQRSVRTLVRRPYLACALLMLTLPGTLPGGSQSTAKQWDRVFRRVESTQIHGEATFPVYCVQRLLREKRLEKGASALVIACGDGRNAVPIAKEGLAVTGLDISTVALEKTRAAAEKHGVQLETIQADMYEHDLGDGRWDLVTNIYYNSAIRILDRFEAAVRPGGFLLVEGFGSDHDGGWRGALKPRHERPPIQLPEDLSPGCGMISLRPPPGSRRRLRAGSSPARGSASTYSTRTFPSRRKIRASRVSRRCRRTP